MLVNIIIVVKRTIEVVENAKGIVLLILVSKFTS